MGNAESIAVHLAEACRQAGLDTEAVELNTIEPTALSDVSHLVVVTSTWGDGELPDNGSLFWEALSADDAPALADLSFTVCGLGESTYPLFNNASKVIDARLDELGATRIADRQIYDEYIDGDAADWVADTVKLLEAARTATVGADETPAVTEHDPSVLQWERKHPFRTQILVNRLLTKPGSTKEVRHYELSLDGSDITYAAGDSVAVRPVNDPALVDAMLDHLGVSGDMVPDGFTKPLHELLSHREIRAPHRELRALVGARTTHAETKDVLLGLDPERLTEWLYGRDLLDLLEHAEVTVDELLEHLRPLAARDYSIASSPLAHPERLHLTVATVRYQMGGRERGGVASNYLNRAGGQEVEIHLRPNHTFRLPAPDVPIIMIGPGTGVAPFRAFLEERRVTGATGRNWLFFGDRNRATDFLYQEDLEGFVADGTLNRLDLAFSRDAGEKEYVQHKMADNAAELYAWLQDGARVYVCGDATAMAPDVDRALRAVVADGGGLDADAAHAYVNDLIRDHRYLRDVY
ncbi:sulfite reductase flavoprotein subunit alpha [Mycolicibacterium brumae]|nr:sulfite reductase flavoprotein subunit alpha [Mycolicibacterium brumae]